MVPLNLAQAESVNARILPDTNNSLRCNALRTETEAHLPNSTKPKKKRTTHVMDENLNRKRIGMSHSDQNEVAEAIGNPLLKITV